MLLTVFSTLFLEKKHPKCGDYIKIISIEKGKHFVGIEGQVIPFKKGHLALEKENVKYIISLAQNKVQYEMNGQKFKI